MRRPLLALLAAAAALLAAAPSAHALIQIDRGIAGARIGNTKAEVRAALGRPASVRNLRNEFGPVTVFRYDGGIRVTFQGRREVTGVSTTGLGDRTSRGVGVGSRAGAVERRVPGVTCETVGADRLCHTGEFAAGQRITAFMIRGGKVRRVDVGIVID